MLMKVARIISIVTVVPFIALFILTLLFIYKGDIFDYKTFWYILSLVFLTLIPMSAYPLKEIIPAFKKQGRVGERRLAFIMGVIGQILGVITALAFGAPKGVKIIFLTYLMSGIILSSINGIIGFKASGHACGVSGPIALLVYFTGYRGLYASLILPFVFWARLKLKRHTVSELITGTLVGILACFIVIAIN
jgi:hypothetical protein